MLGCAGRVGCLFSPNPGLRWRGEAGTALVWGQGMETVEFPRPSSTQEETPTPNTLRLLAGPFGPWGAGSWGAWGCWSWLGVASALFEH